MRFSVIVPTFNRIDLLAKCLDGIVVTTQRLAGADYEVIVTDDGSVSAKESLGARFPSVTWIAGPRMGPAANRNNGAKHAKGEWLVFTDDDCIPDPGWLEAYAQGIQDNPGLAVFEGRTFPDCPRTSLAQSCPENKRGGCLWSCNLAVKKSLFTAIGGFDARFPYAAMEDIEFKYRIRHSGEKTFFLPGASVCHPWRCRSDWATLKRIQKSMLIYLDIHPDERKRISSRFYVRSSFSLLRKSTIPGLFKFRGAGLKYELLEHFSFWKMAWTLLFRNRGTALKPAQNVKTPGSAL